MNAVGLTTGVSVTNPLNQTSSTTLDTTRGLTLTSTDPNGVVTTQQHDALGRNKAVWTDSRATSLPANYTFDYQVSKTGVTATTTKKMSELSLYQTSVTIYDGSVALGESMIDFSLPGVVTLAGEVVVSCPGPGPRRRPHSSGSGSRLR